MARPARKARGSRGTAPATPSRGGSCTCAGSRWTCDRRKSSCGSSTSSRPRWTRCARAQISPPFAPANPPRSQKKRTPTQANSQDRGNFGVAFFFFSPNEIRRARRPPRAFFRFLTRSRLFPRNPAGRLEHPGKVRRHRRRRPPAHDAASERRGGGPRRRRRRRRETLRLGSARRRRRICGPDGERGRNCGCFNRGRFKGCGCFDRGCFNR